jgi:hypothetical protein
VVPEGLRSALDESHEARHLMARRYCLVHVGDPGSMERVAQECPVPIAILVVAQQGKATGLVASWPADQPVTEKDLKIHARTAGSRKIDDLIGVVSDERIARTTRSWSALMA